jgi:hypothetical protein
VRLLKQTLPEAGHLFAAELAAEVAAVERRL